MKDHSLKCKFFVPREREDVCSRGDCRRYPPRTHVTWNKHGEPQYRSWFPQTVGDKFCGEFQSAIEE
jgi:hypothetical protein